MFSNAIRLFDFFGFKVRVDPSWLLIAGLIVWSLSTGYFPEAVPGLGPVDSIAISVVAMLGLFACLILHELSHSLVARRFGLGVGGITLFLFGGVAELEQEPQSPTSEFWIAVAGPAMSFALAAAASILAGAARSGGAAPALIALIEYLAAINLILAVFNLLPAFPLDGGRILRAVLWHFRNDVMSATRIATQLGSALAYAMIIIGFFGLFSGEAAVTSIWPILLGLFLLAAAKGTYRQMLLKAAMRGRTVGMLMSATPWTTTPGSTIQEVVDDVILAHGVSFVPVLEGGRPIGMIDTAAIRSIDRENWDTTRVDDILIARSPEMIARPADSLESLFERITNTGRRKYLVESEGRLVGVVSLSDVMVHIGLLQELGAWSRSGRPVHHLTV